MRVTLAQSSVTQFNKGQRVLPAEGNRSAFSNRWGSYVTVKPWMPQSERKTCNAVRFVLWEIISLPNLHDQDSQQLLGGGSLSGKQSDVNPMQRAKCQICVQMRQNSQVTLACLDTDHVHHLWVNGLCDDVPVVGDVLHHLAQRRPLHLLPFQVAQRVRDEVKEDAALPQLLDEQLLLLCRGNVWKRKIYIKNSGIEAGKLKKRTTQKMI